MRCPFADHDAEVEAVSRSRAVAVLASGERIAITNWIDWAGDECRPDDAVVAVAGPDEQGRWFAIDLSAFEPAFLN